MPLPGAPALQGENNVEVLKSLGYDDGAIQSLEASGALVGNFASIMIASVMAQVETAQGPETGDEECPVSESDDA